LGSTTLSAAAELAGQEGNAGAFFNGVLATALATPCTAPFLGTALGFAFAQPSWVVVLTFLTVGAGLALPYLALSWFPAWLRFLPKPGPWMERFMVAMGFPMLGTAIWLLSLAQVHYGKRAWWLGLFLVVVALTAWIYGEFVQRGRTRRGLAMVVAVLLLAGGYVYALEGQLRWRAPSDPSSPAVLREGPEGIPWVAWSRATVERARAEGRPVFVDFTADWCVTCQANKKTSIEIPAVRAKLKEINALPLLGDYTKVPADITDELRRFGRAGVPLVLVYPRNTNSPAIILPELLTPGLVLRALEKAAE
jgi:thiol:disulfide interchange protein DsbD